VAMVGVEESGDRAGIRNQQHKLVIQQLRSSHLGKAITLRLEHVIVINLSMKRKQLIIYIRLRNCETSGNDHLYTFLFFSLLGKQVETASAEERFQSASAQYKESIKRHLGENGAGDENLSSDEEDLDTGVLDKVFQTYKLPEGWKAGSCKFLIIYMYLHK